MKIVKKAITEGLDLRAEAQASKQIETARSDKGRFKMKTK